MLPALIPTAQQRQMVEMMASYRVDQVEICKLIINPNTNKPIAPKTLRKVFRAELDTGMVKANAKVAESLILQAVGAPAVYDAAGHKIRAEQPRIISATIFWAKCRMGWRETEAVEMTGKNGAAIPIVISKNQAAY